MRAIHPTSDLGYVASDLAAQIRGKADENEVLSLRSSLDCIERAVEQIRTELSCLCSQVQTIQEDVRQLNEGKEEKADATTGS